MRLRISQAIADSPITCTWDERDEYGRYCAKVSHVAARCRLSADDEFLVARRCTLINTKEGVVRRVVVPQFNQYHMRRAARVISGHMVGDAQDRQNIKAMLGAANDAIWAECEEHIERAEVRALLVVSFDRY